jgi:hypothetical protein
MMTMGSTIANVDFYIVGPMEIYKFETVYISLSLTKTLELPIRWKY